MTSSRGKGFDPPEERELVLEAQGGSRVAADALVRRFRPSAFVMALQLVGNREDARDIVQDAFIRFFAAIDRFDAKRPVAPWLRRIVRNLAYDLHRRGKVRAADSLDSDGPEGQRMILPAGGTSSHAKAEMSELRSFLWQSVQGLRPAQREILVLRDYQDLSYEEIAETLTVPMGTVMSRLHRARKELRRVVMASDDGRELLRRQVESQEEASKAAN